MDEYCFPPLLDEAEDTMEFPYTGKLQVTMNYSCLPSYIRVSYPNPWKNFRVLGGGIGNGINTQLKSLERLPPVLFQTNLRIV